VSNDGNDQKTCSTDLSLGSLKPWLRKIPC